MKKSSTAQLSFDLSGPELSPSTGSAATPELEQTAPAVETFTTGATPLKFPTFGGYGEVYAATSRMAGRLNAASTTEQEYNDLLHKRTALLDKHFAGTITKEETHRLELVRWGLDRIEDAKSGFTLDALEAFAAQYEHLLSDIEAFRAELTQQTQSKRGRR